MAATNKVLADLPRRQWLSPPGIGSRGICLCHVDSC
jgi:hypothetical protein